MRRALRFSRVDLTSAAQKLFSGAVCLAYLTVALLQSRRLYRELVTANEELQERRKAAQAQQKTEESRAFACAEKLQQREAMIRKRKEELRAWALDRSERLTAQGAAVLAAARVKASPFLYTPCSLEHELLKRAFLCGVVPFSHVIVCRTSASDVSPPCCPFLQAEEARHQEIQVARFEADVKQAEEAKQLSRLAMQLQLKESRDNQVEAKRREKETKRMEDIAYAESLRKAAVAAQADEDRKIQERRIKLWKVGEDQKRQAREQQESKKLQRERALEEERKAHDNLREADLMLQRFADQGIAAAKAVGAEWRILEKAKKRLLRESSLDSPPRSKNADSGTATPPSPMLCMEQCSMYPGCGASV